MLPADLRNLVDLTTREAVAGVARFAVTGAAQGAREIEDWGARMRLLADRWAAGNIDTHTLRRAVESEREWLALRLAALANIQARGFALDILTRSLMFIAAILKA